MNTGEIAEIINGIIQIIETIGLIILILKNKELKNGTKKKIIQ